MFRSRSRIAADSARGWGLSLGRLPVAAPLILGLLLLLLLLLLLSAAAAAGAAGAARGGSLAPGFPAFPAPKLAPNEREIGGEIVILQGGAGNGEEGGCSYTVPVVRYPAVKDAIGYRAVVYDTYYGNRTLGGPPFQDDSPYGKAPSGTHQHELAGLFGNGGAEGCGEAAAYYRERMTFLSAVAIFKPDDTPRIVGTVRTADGTGKAGVKVTAAGPRTVSTKTDVTGYYRMKVKKGRYAVSARPHCVVGAAGCKQSKTVKVTSGAQQVDFGPRPRVTLSGRVVEQQCDRLACTAPVGLEGAGVGASSADGEDPALARTGPDGNWSVEVPAGRWKVAAAQEGRSFKPSVRRVDAEGNSGGLDFESCQPVGSLAGSSCDPDGIDWRMPDRLSAAIAKKEFRMIGLPSEAFLDPPTWEMELSVTIQGLEAKFACNRRRSELRWRWEVKPRKADTDVKGKIPDGCRTRAHVTRLGDFDVKAILERRIGGSWEEEHRVGPVKVTLDDVILAGVGDSSASGEGNPKFYFEKCDRSVVAYQFQAALFVEQQDPHTSVTFLHPACSGARLDHMWKRPFRGTRSDTHLPPQLAQIADRLRGLRRKPKVAAAMAGVGVNDIGFGPILEHCLGPILDARIPAVPCPDGTVDAVRDADGFVTQFYSTDHGRPLSSWIDDLMRALKPRYAAFMTHVRAGLEDDGLGLRKPARVLLTQYPNFSHNKDGVCDTSGNTIPPVWSTRTWGWMSELGERLSEVIRESSALGYTPVPMNQSTFHPHGYCVYDGTSWFVGILQSRWRQGNFNGGFHPNADAHAVIADETRAKLCEALYGNPACEGRFRG